MPDLVQEIYERVRHLDAQQQERVLDFIAHIDEPEFDFEAWLTQVNQIRADLRSRYGDQIFLDPQITLDEVREESSWPRSSS
ncbi:MAG: hypothetical protein JNM70_21255 [Anaerolineae bacterium]|nr:hypothetical protein [Anaerolineae bacterium]